MIFDLILLQGSSGGGSAFMAQMMLIGGILLIFYLFMVMPQQRKQKAQQKFRDNMQVGDEVVTIGGLHGKIQAVENETITIQVDKGVKLIFEKYAISPEATEKLKNGNKNKPVSTSNTASLEK